MPAPRNRAVTPEAWAPVIVDGVRYRVALVREDAPARPRACDRPTFDSAENVAAYVRDLQGLSKEHFDALLLDTKNHLIERVHVSVGSLNASIVHPRELYREAVRHSAASVVVVHNHPSGDPAPSGADLQLTRRLAKAGDVLGIELLDHVIIGDGGAHTSMREMGIL